ncbi:hypothetical protein A200_03564 [Parascardovia denticolens IPLA 20019]|uniref:DUF3021 domain-containing protein n=1 Tax=Parascardovia denticolens TaxID=78258 RepID=UPI000266BAF7|nr:DUF3021 domain-containing protein [Parascardovia denticolens]EIT88456.1 hypothetical protein A200_03564 [Parascardovia denticolens IPLA 20019]
MNQEHLSPGQADSRDWDDLRTNEEEKPPALGKILWNGIKGAGLGMLIGGVASLLSSALNHTKEYYPAPPRFMAHFPTQLEGVAASFLLWCLIGLVFSWGNYVWQKTAWSLLKRTIVHCLICYVLSTILMVCAGWFPLNVPWMIIYTLIWFLVYAVVWSISVWRAHKEVDAVNARIQTVNARESEDQRSDSGKA